MGICPKVNVVARLEYELAYNDFAVHRFNHYTTRTPPTFRRDSVSLMRLLFRCHVHVFSWEISPVYRLKYPYSCFSSHFRFEGFVDLYAISGLSGCCNKFIIIIIITLRVFHTSVSLAQSAGAIEYTDCFTPTSVLDMTRNNRMVRLQ